MARRGVLDMRSALKTLNRVKGGGRLGFALLGGAHCDRLLLADLGVDFDGAGVRV